MRPPVRLMLMAEDYIHDHPGISHFDIRECFGSTRITYANRLYSDGIRLARLDYEAGRAHGNSIECYAYIHVLTPHDTVDRGHEYRTMYEYRCKRRFAI